MVKKDEKELLKGGSWGGNMVVICMVALAQGVLGLAELSMSYLYKDDFGMSPAQVSVATSITSLPWIMKPLWGFISDCFPIAGRRRAPYLAAFGMLGVTAWSCMSTMVNSPIAAILTMLIIQICNSFCNVIGEALVVEEAKRKGASQEEASKNVSMFFGVRSVGMIVTAYTGGLLLEVLSKRTVFLITACFPLLLCSASLILEEMPIDEEPKVREQISEIWKFIRQPAISLPITFIFLFMVTPSTGDAMFYFYTNELGFRPEFMGRLRMIWGVATLLGIIIYNKYLKEVSFKKILVVSSFICSFMGLFQILLVTRANVYLGIPDTVFSLCSGFLVQAIGEINTMPLLVMCCKLCPQKIEGTLYALLMSTMNFGGMIAYQLGGLLMIVLGIDQHNFGLLWLLVLLVNLFTLLPLPLLYFVPELSKAQEKAGYDNI